MKVSVTLVTQLSSKMVTLVVFGLSIFGLASVLYYRRPAEGLVPALLLCAGLYLLSSTLKSRAVIHFPLSKPRILFFLLLGLPAISLLCQMAFSLNAIDIDGRSSINQALNFWAVGSLWLIAGAGMASASLSYSNARAFLLLGVLILLLWFGSDGRFVVNYGKLSAGTGVKFSHLSTGDYAVFVLVFAYGLSRGVRRAIVIVVALFVLFALGGRAALFSFAAAVLFMQVFQGGNRLFFRILIAALLIFIFVILFSYFQQFARSNLVNKDLFFSGGFGSDGSVVARLNQFFLGFDDLWYQALVGDPSLIVKRFGSVGSYMHNFLSAWQFYGLLFFLVIVLSLVYAMRLAYVRRLTCQDALSTAFMLLLIYVVISVLIAKSVTFYLLWLTLGFWLERGALAKPHDSERLNFSYGSRST